VPKTLTKLQLDYNSVKKYNESLIYASVNGFPDGNLENK
jgi:crotonobetainyl-CoA:carnitine CoA-transferase CaiB-like acyl-CoA transferase